MYKLNQIAYGLSVRVRYAPSPTGPMHMGALRTAYFNYLFAKQQKGQFIVRIEDTDKARNVENGAQAIQDVLEWAGIRPDQSPRFGGQYGPYIQSQRMGIYKSLEQSLLKHNLAYPCFCNSQKEQYPRTCRVLTLQQLQNNIRNNMQYAVRIKSDILPYPQMFKDEIFGMVKWSAFDDFVIVRKDGTPTFHFSNVIDDWKMKITHVIRGVEWLGNTPKHIYLYKLFNADVPKFIHMPLIESLNGKKLSKRDPFSSMQHLIDKQYEPQAIRNTLFRLGMAGTIMNVEQSKVDKQKKQRVKDRQQQKIQQSQNKQTKEKKIRYIQRIHTESELLAVFDFNKMGLNPIKFDPKLLTHLNRISLRKKFNEIEVTDAARNYFINKSHHYIPATKLLSQKQIFSFLASIIERLTVISDLSQYNYYFQSPCFTSQRSRADCRKIFGPNAQFDGQKMTNVVSSSKNRKILQHLKLIFEQLLPSQSYTQESIVKRISQFLCQSPECNNEDIFQMLRFIVSGHREGPNIGKACIVIGQQEIIKRINAFSSY